MTPYFASRPVRLSVFALTVVSTLAGVAAAALAPILVRDHPLVLLMLQPTSAQMLLVSGKLGFGTFVVVATVRRFIGEYAWFLLGVWYGERAVNWMKARAGSRRGLVEGTERIFPRFAPPLIFFVVSPVISLIAGATRMRPWRFIALKLGGCFGVVLAHRFIADAASGPLAVAVRWIEGHALPLTALFTLGTVLMLFRERRQGRQLLGSLRDIERESESGRVVPAPALSE